MTAAGIVPPFVAPRLVSNGHLQTILAATLRPQPRLARLSRQRIELADGDFIDVETAFPDTDTPATAWVLVLHGLAGSSRSITVRGMAAALLDAGYEVCLMNHRGCSGEPNRLPRSYHAGASDDVLAVMRRLCGQRPGRPFAAVGFSIGANMLMKLLGSQGADVPAGLAATVAVSPPFDLVRCVEFLDRPFRLQGIYRRALLRELRAGALGMLARFPGCVAASAADLKAARTFTAFDSLYTAPLHGFACAHDYWRRASGSRCLAGIGYPMLVLASADDPFFPPGYVPREAITANPHLTLALTSHGGHCGFMGGPVWSPTFWVEEATVSYLARHLPQGKGASHQK